MPTPTLEQLKNQILVIGEAKEKIGQTNSNKNWMPLVWFSAAIAGLAFYSKRGKGSDASLGDTTGYGQGDWRISSTGMDGLANLFYKNNLFAKLNFLVLSKEENREIKDSLPKDSVNGDFFEVRRKNGDRLIIEVIGRRDLINAYSFSPSFAEGKMKGIQLSGIENESNGPKKYSFYWINEIISTPQIMTFVSIFSPVNSIKELHKTAKDEGWKFIERKWETGGGHYIDPKKDKSYYINEYKGRSYQEQSSFGGTDVDTGGIFDTKEKAIIRGRIWLREHKLKGIKSAYIVYQDGKNWILEFYTDKKEWLKKEEQLFNRKIKFTHFSTF